MILDRIDYEASDGKEIFLQYINAPLFSGEGGVRSKKLFALLRLRIPPETRLRDNFIPALRNAAIIRELHTYGKLAKINEKDASSPQHIGLGKKLIQEAEKIAKKEFGLHPHTKGNISRLKNDKDTHFGVGVNKITVISGVGVRDYYRKLGYKLKDTYMVKTFNR